MQIHDTKKSEQLSAISPEAFAMLGAPSIVYIKQLTPDELRQIPGAPEDAELFALHAADGTRMAVLGSRAAALMTAQEHEMVPVSVH